ncbi:MAG: tRNA pseudouridine38-40 synthase [Glaciecola sp.]|jgi:tRNA pseudouridine38-40 synthase
MGRARSHITPTVRLRIDLAYDGGPFNGFARQHGLTTVQGSLERALHLVFGQELDTACAGRTDKGVHARGQVVHVDLEIDPELERAQKRTSTLLADLDAARSRLDHAVGDAISIWSVRQVAQNFHARFSATRRSYRYRIVDSPAMDPLGRGDAWHVRGELALRPMQLAAKHLLGTHDFASLCRNRDKKTTVRRLIAITVVRPEPGAVEIRLTGRSFCQQQVRSIAGCLVAIGHGEHEPAWMAEVVAARDRGIAAAVAPANALVLESVSYGGKFPSSPLVQ